MCTINNQMAPQSFDKLKVEKLVKTDILEILNICLEKDAVFPEKVAPTDAQLFVLEEDMVFYSNGKSYPFKTQQHFNFPKDEKHWVKANESSKFLVIR